LKDVKIPQAPSILDISSKFSIGHLPSQLPVVVDTLLLFADSFGGKLKYAT